jgi:hypothetical protein
MLNVLRPKKEKEMSWKRMKKTSIHSPLPTQTEPLSESRFSE